MSSDLPSQIAPGVKRALLIGDQGNHFLTTLEVAPLLKRSGFNIDVVTLNPTAKHLRSVSHTVLPSQATDLPRAALLQISARNYDLLVVLEDFTLKAILESDLTDQEKLALLPVTGMENFEHIGSKIGLSEVFRRHGIPSPEFAVAKDQTKLLTCTEKMGYPVLVKIDFSGAGDGIFLLSSPEEARSTADKIVRWPVLVQALIEGEELDLSGLYQGGELLCFSYSKIGARVGSEFSPSSLRTYTQLGRVDRDIFEELQAIGRATGANGFVNISCIRSSDDGKRYYFEADLRPNAWVNAGHLFGDDPARHIARYFASGATMTYPQPLHGEFAERVVVPSFARIKLWELATNRYGAWRALPDDRLSSILLTLAELKFKDFARGYLKPLVPGGLWPRLKRAYDMTFRKVMG